MTKDIELGTLYLLDLVQLIRATMGMIKYRQTKVQIIMKIVITGNSGSGKTWLAQKLASHKSDLIHLDSIFWQPGGFDQKRDIPEIEALIRESLQNEQWVVEGVFGELLTYYIPHASTFIWLDMPWEPCRRRLEQRGSESKKHMDRAQSSEGLKKLIEWARHYYTRTNMKSRIGHKQIFDEFTGVKVCLRSEEEVNSYLKVFHGGALTGKAENSR